MMHYSLIGGPQDGLEVDLDPQLDETDRFWRNGGYYVPRGEKLVWIQSEYIPSTATIHEAQGDKSRSPLRQVCGIVLGFVKFINTLRTK